MFLFFIIFLEPMMTFKLFLLIVLYLIVLFFFILAFRFYNSMFELQSLFTVLVVLSCMMSLYNKLSITSLLIHLIVLDFLLYCFYNYIFLEFNSVILISVLVFPLVDEFVVMVKIFKFFISFCFAIFTYFFIMFYNQHLSILGFKTTTFIFTISFLFTILSVFIINTYCFILSTLFLSIFIFLLVSPLILFFKVFYKGYLAYVYFIILNVLKVTTVLYFNVLFISHTNVLLVFLCNSFSVLFFSKVLYVLLLAYVFGIDVGCILIFLMLEDSFYNIFLLLINFVFVNVNLLFCYYFYFIYLINFIFSNSYMSSTPDSKVRSLGKSCFSQCPFRGCHSHTSPDKVFCNVFYPNPHKRFSEKSLLFDSGNKGVNFYCTEGEFNFVLKSLYSFEAYEAKLGDRMSLLVYKLGAITYIRISSIKGYNFINREYFLIHFNRNFLHQLYNNSLSVSPFFKGILIEVDVELWLSRINENGIFKDDFLSEISNVNKTLNVSNYDLSIIKSFPTNPFSFEFPLTTFDLFITDFYFLQTCLRSDRGSLNQFFKSNNHSIKISVTGYEKESIRVLTIVSYADYQYYLRNCKGYLVF